ncbi:MAG: AIPR family protein [bacterium JZ-2024 1]
MVYQDADELIRKLSIQNKVEATKKLTEFYVEARFKVSDDDFNRQYTDGANDGGIDFYHREDNNFFIFQTKFSETPRKTGVDEILDEIKKLKNTLIMSNPNKKADDFVNALKKEVENEDAVLEILWLTTNIVEQSVRDEIQKDLEKWRKENGWKIAMDFVAIDKNTLEGVIYDVKHGYIPYTGKKILKLEQGQWIESTGWETGVHSIVCTVNVNDILKWFRTSYEIDKFLQKNVREFLSETSKINKAIGKSYLDSPDWFWYKHNGIIIFADNLFIDKTKRELVLRNPQVVNGGQTLKALFSVYNKNNRADNSAKVLLRIYRLPYEDTETYKRSIEIISALNSQNKINPSDLRSTDPRQVRLEQLFKKIGSGYKYLRKRSKEAKSGRFSITMRNLALRYYVCMKNAPHEGVRGNVEELFEEENKYDEIFDESAINKDLSGNHVVINYVTCWNIDHLLQKVDLPNRDAEYFQYTKWFVLWDIYRKLMEWKQKKFNLGGQMWINFIESPQFEKAVYDYARRAFRIGREIIPAREEARSFFKTKGAGQKFREKVGTRNFGTIMNKALNRFQKENE